MYPPSSVINLSGILFFFLPLKLCVVRFCKKRILLPARTKEVTLAMILFYSLHVGILAKT